MNLRGSEYEENLKLTDGRLTNGDAAGPSRIASSSFVNGNRGIRCVRTGSRSIIITGNPMAAVSDRTQNTMKLAASEHKSEEARTDGLSDCESYAKANELDGDEEDDA